MAELLCAGTPKTVVSQFFADPTTGHEVTGACGVAAVYHALCVYHGVTPSESGYQACYRAMRQGGSCDADGITTMAAMMAFFTRTTHTALVASQPWTGADQSANVQHLLDRYAGLRPIAYQTSVGQRLVNALTNTGERATNLQRHFLVIVGQHTGGYSPRAGRVLPAGYWAMDGCNFAVAWQGLGPLVFYPVEVLASTHPIAAAVVALPVASKPAPKPVVSAPKPTETKPAPPKPTPGTAAEVKLLANGDVAHYFEAVVDPAGQNQPAWRCRQNGYVVRAGMLDGYSTEPSRTALAGLDALGLPLENEHPLHDAGSGKTLPNTAAQRFERGILVWDPAHAYDRPPGVTSPYYHAHIAYSVDAQ